MNFDDVVTGIKKLNPGEKDVLVLATVEELPLDEKRELAQMLLDRGISNLVVVMWDLSDIMSLNEEFMAQWGWLRTERLKAVLENMPGREKLETIDAEHWGAGS